jgi:cytochrome c-type biogenesis protein CcmH
MSNSRLLSRRLKSWPGWVLLVLVVVGFGVVGATRDRGPLDPGDRIDELSRRVACPVCDGESVYESRNPASEAIRAAIREAVSQGTANDDAILAAIAEAYGGRVLLVPRATGFDALVWALPVTAGVIGIVALVFAFRRWRIEAGLAGVANDEDYQIVAAERERLGDAGGD